MPPACNQGQSREIAPARGGGCRRPAPAAACRRPPCPAEGRSRSARRSAEGRSSVGLWGSGRSVVVSTCMRGGRSILGSRAGAFRWTCGESGRGSLACLLCELGDARDGVEDCRVHRGDDPGERDSPAGGGAGSRHRRLGRRIEAAQGSSLVGLIGVDLMREVINAHHQRSSSEVIGAHRCSSVLISAHQRSSALIVRGHQGDGNLGPLFGRPRRRASG
jgi:hypothetical protein